MGNLYVSHNDRHPLFKGGGRAAAVNNVIHIPASVSAAAEASRESRWFN